MPQRTQRRPDPVVPYSGSLAHITGPSASRYHLSSPKCNMRDYEPGVKLHRLRQSSGPALRRALIVGFVGFQSLREKDSMGRRVVGLHKLLVLVSRRHHNSSAAPVGSRGVSDDCGQQYSFHGSKLPKVLSILSRCKGSNDGVGREHRMLPRTIPVKCGIWGAGGHIYFDKSSERPKLIGVFSSSDVKRENSTISRTFQNDGPSASWEEYPFPSSESTSRLNRYRCRWWMIS